MGFRGILTLPDAPKAWVAARFASRSHEILDAASYTAMPAAGPLVYVEIPVAPLSIELPGSKPRCMASAWSRLKFVVFEPDWPVRNENVCCPVGPPSVADQ